MSAEHKRPLVAFVMVSILCAVMLGHAIRSDALVGLLGSREPVAAAQHQPNVSVCDTAPAVAPTSAPAGLRGLSAEQPVTSAPTPADRPTSTATATGVAHTGSVASAAPVPVTQIPTPSPTPTPTPEVGTGDEEAAPSTVSARKAARAAAKAATRALKIAAKASEDSATAAAKAADKAAKLAAKLAAEEAKVPEKAVLKAAEQAAETAEQADTAETETDTTLAGLAESGVLSTDLPTDSLVGS